MYWNRPMCSSVYISFLTVRASIRRSVSQNIFSDGTRRYGVPVSQNIFSDGTRRYGVPVSQNRLSHRTSLSEGILYFYPHLSHLVKSQPMDKKLYMHIGNI